MHYYPHHIGDFIRDTANLTDAQSMAYLRMLWKYYTDEAPLSDSCERIAFAVRSDAQTVRLILEHYFTETPEGWRHGRCDEVIAGIYTKSEKARESAKHRWKNANASGNDANALPTHSERNANEPKNDATQYPIPNTKTTKIKNSRSADADHSPEFVRFWDQYPRKDAKKKAWEVWRSRRLDQHVDQIVGNVTLRVASDPQWKDSQYIPHATTYLNQERWKDPVQQRATSPPKPQSKQAQGLMALAQFGGFVDGNAEERNHAGSRPALQLEPGRLPIVGGSDHDRGDVA